MAAVVVLVAAVSLVAALGLAVWRPEERTAGAGLLGLGLLLAVGSGVVRTASAVRARARRSTPRGRAAVAVVVLAAVAVAVAAGAVPGAGLSVPDVGALLLRLAPIGIILTAAGAGLVLLADVARVPDGEEARATVRPWALLTGGRPDDRPSRRAGGRALVGAALIVAAGTFGVLVASTYLRGHPALVVVSGALVAASALAALAAPIAIAALAAYDRARLQRNRDHERERVAAHLHDSVLQTLALVRRHADDPAAVDKLARDQERQLRTWLADGATFSADTLAGALRDVVAETFGTRRPAVTVTITGDRPLDPTGDAVAGSAREALRNAAEHAPGAAVFVFAQITAGEITVFVRDDGPGFDPGQVPPERRGVRDSIVRRMANVGGTVTIDTEPGAGCEITLHVRPPRTP